MCEAHEIIEPSIRAKLVKEFTKFREETGLSESYLGKQAGLGTGFFDRVRDGGANVRSIEKFQKFVANWGKSDRKDGPTS